MNQNSMKIMKIEFYPVTTAGVLLLSLCRTATEDLESLTLGVL